MKYEYIMALDLNSVNYHMMVRCMVSNVNLSLGTITAAIQHNSSLLHTYVDTICMILWYIGDVVLATRYLPWSAARCVLRDMHINYLRAKHLLHLAFVT